MAKAPAGTRKFARREERKIERRTGRKECSLAFMCRIVRSRGEFG